MYIGMYTDNVRRHVRLGMCHKPSERLLSTRLPRLHPRSPICHTCHSPMPTALARHGCTAQADGNVASWRAGIEAEGRDIMGAVCNILHHAPYRTMHHTTPCTIPHHATYRTMQHTAPRTMPRHATYRTMHHTAPCTYRIMQHATPCTIPHHATYRAMQHTAPCNMPHHATHCTMHHTASCNIPCNTPYHAMLTDWHRYAGACDGPL